MAEAIVSTILEHLTSLATEKASKAWSLVTGVKEKVKWLESNFQVLQLELADAEEKQFADKRVKLWLDGFKEVAYDMEDVLEDWKIALQQLQSKGGVGTSSASVSKWKVLSCLSSCLSCFSFGSHVVRRYDIATRIEEINKYVDQIVKEREDFKLNIREIKQAARWRESTSFVDVSKLLGRDSVKEDIIRLLLDEEGSCCDTPPTIVISGMAGIGKTALAQLAFNDQRTEDHFELKFWVCVSESFDQIPIAQAILGVLDPDSTHGQDSNPKLQPLLEKISKKVRGKKFFLVLDDVWADRAQDWEPFTVAFKTGSLGSKILVTTRNRSVADQMAEPSHVFCLDLLSQEVCWMILKQVAFSRRNKNIGEILEDIGMKVAEKCKGLPLVAKTLGGLLLDKHGLQEWQKVLKSEIWCWNLDLAEKDIFAPLGLSYCDLPTTIRQCLLYCAIFPKGSCLTKSELIQHWRAQGYLNSIDKSEIESKGEDYFKCLASRSFFQDFLGDSGGEMCTMHDTVHDFLQYLTRCEIVAKETDNNSIENLGLDSSSRKARHLRLVIRRGSDFPKSIHGTEKLRSLIVVDSESHITDEVLCYLLGVSKRLRLLDIDSGRVSKVKEIPHEIGKLIHLRYLGLRRIRINKLPESICELYNLEYLDLRDCDNLERLPDGIGKLLSLNYLYTKGCMGLTYYPKAIGRLTSLVELTDIIARVDRHDTKEFSIGDLEDLNFLRGVLSMKLVGVDAIDGKEVERAKLDKKEHLQGLHIMNICQDDVVKDKIVRALNPPSNLHVGFASVPSSPSAPPPPAQSSFPSAPPAPFLVAPTSRPRAPAPSSLPAWTSDVSYDDSIDETACSYISSVRERIRTSQLDEPRWHRPGPALFPAAPAPPSPPPATLPPLSFPSIPSIPLRPPRRGPVKVAIFQNIVRQLPEVMAGRMKTSGEESSIFSSPSTSWLEQDEQDDEMQEHEMESDKTTKLLQPV